MDKPNYIANPKHKPIDFFVQVVKHISGREYRTHDDWTKLMEYVKNDMCRMVGDYIFKKKKYAEVVNPPTPDAKMPYTEMKIKTVIMSPQEFAEFFLDVQDMLLKRYALGRFKKLTLQDYQEMVEINSITINKTEGEHYGES